MSTIDIDKVNVCDSCFKTKRVNDKEKDIIKIEFESSRKIVYLCEEYATFVLSSISSINGFKETSEKNVVFIPPEEIIKEFIDKTKGKEAEIDTNELVTMALLLFTKNYWMEGK